MNVKGIGYRIRGHTYHSYTEVPGRRDARLEHVSPFTNVCIARLGDGIVRFYVFVSTSEWYVAYAATKTTEPHSFWPILAALGNSIVWSAYGLLSYDIFPLFVTNFIGALLNFYYCRVFFQFEKKRILFLIASFILFSALVVIIWETVSDEEDEDALDRLGFIGCIICVLMVSINYCLDHLFHLQRRLRQLYCKINLFPVRNLF